MPRTAHDPIADPDPTASSDPVPAGSLVDEGPLVNIVAVIGLGVSIVALLVTLFLAASIVAPIIAVAGTVVSGVGIGISHRRQDQFGGTGGYWFALAGLLIGIGAILVILATFTTAA